MTERWSEHNAPCVYSAPTSRSTKKNEDFNSVSDLFFPIDKNRVRCVRKLQIESGSVLLQACIQNE
jgi:hypothetical protein